MQNRHPGLSELSPTKFERMSTFERLRGDRCRHESVLRPSNP